MVLVRAEREVRAEELLEPRCFRYLIDGAARRAPTGVRARRSFDHLDTFEIERIAVRVLREIAHTIHVDVVRRVVAANLEDVAARTAGLTGEQADAGDVAQDF